MASTLPFSDDGTAMVDHAALAEHVSWLAENGCDGVVVNGSLGEYQTLTEHERAGVTATAFAAAPAGFHVVPGIAAYGAREARALADSAGAMGAPAVMLLPPNAYRGDAESVMEHYRLVAEAGVPIIAYNNPIDTKIDLTPELLARLHDEGLIVAVKEFSGDVRRGYQLAEAAPGLDLIAGADDVLLELALAGAVGWIAGYPNALPRVCSELFRAATSGDLDVALPLYRALHPLLRWDSRTEFVQAIKLSMDIAGRYGGPCRPPRLALDDATTDDIKRATEGVLGLDAKSGVMARVAGD